MERSNYIFFQGNTQYENTGDVLINKSLIQLLRVHGDIIVNNAEMPDWYIEDLNLKPEECISSTGQSFNAYLIKQVLNSKAANKNIFLIAGPPGHLFGNSRQKSFRNLISSGLFVFLRLYGVKIIKMGFSIGPIGRTLGITEFLRAATNQYYLVRDSLSLKLAKSLGIKHARFYPDLAWMYKVGESTQSNQKTKIIVSFRDSVVQGQSSDLYLDALKKNLFAMIKNIDAAYEIEVIYQVKRDFDFCKKLYVELSKELDVTFNENQVTLGNAVDAYKDALCILTNRLHGALLAYKYGALPLVLTDANDHLKIRGIYMDAGVDDLLLNVNDTIEDNIRKFNALIKGYPVVMGRLNKKELEYNVLSTTILTEVFKK